MALSKRVPATRGWERRVRRRPTKATLNQHVDRSGSQDFPLTLTSENPYETKTGVKSKLSRERDFRKIVLSLTFSHFQSQHALLVFTRLWMTYICRNFDDAYPQLAEFSESSTGWRRVPNRKFETLILLSSLKLRDFSIRHLFNVSFFMTT